MAQPARARQTARLRAAVCAPARDVQKTSASAETSAAAPMTAARAVQRPPKTLTLLVYMSTCIFSVYLLMLCA